MAERPKPTQEQIAHLRRIAPLGGEATAKLAPDHHREAGKKGFEPSCTLYFKGDKAKMMTFLSRRSMEVTDPAPWNGA